MEYNITMSNDENKKDFSKDKFRPKQIKSVSRKEKDSEKNRSKQKLRNYVESGFEDDDYEDNFMR
jgi:hypothetical protein